jgi:hypothetical protein
MVSIDLDGLFRLRAAVGRFGEMDSAGWWNTQGVLGSRGAAVYTRGLPQTQFLARVRVVSSVAADRSQTLYPADGVATLWNLPASLERALSFQERNWATSGANEAWSEFESTIAAPVDSSLVGWLVRLGLVESALADRVEALPIDPGGKGVAVPGPVTDEAIQLLALGHSRGGPRHLIVPFVRDGLEAVVG